MGEWEEVRGEGKGNGREWGMREGDGDVGRKGDGGKG